MKIMKLTTMILLVFAPLAMLLGADDGKPVKEPSELTAARQAYQAEQARATAAYVAKLESLKTKLGTSGRIDDAILVKAEVDKIKAEQDAQLFAEPRSKVVGRWTWFGSTTAEFKANGTAIDSAGFKATWEVKGDNTVVVKWTTGNVDTLIIEGNKTEVISDKGPRFAVKRIK